MNLKPSPPTLDRLLDRLRQALPELKQRYGITQLGVFGSYVRGEQILLASFEDRRGANDSGRGRYRMKEGSKYQPLLEFLRDSNQDELTLSFAEIEALINDTLPDSARTKRAWWSNRSKGALQASAWMEAGYRAKDIDLEQGRF